MQRHKHSAICGIQFMNAVGVYENNITLGHLEVLSIHTHAGRAFQKKKKLKTPVGYFLISITEGVYHFNLFMCKMLEYI